MQNLPSFVYSLAFWKALSYIAAAVYLYFNPDAIVTDVILLTAVLAFLNLFGINPELQAKGLK